MCVGNVYLQSGTRALITQNDEHLASSTLVQGKNVSFHQLPFDLTRSGSTIRYSIKVVPKDANPRDTESIKERTKGPTPLPSLLNSIHNQGSAE